MNAFLSGVQLVTALLPLIHQLVLMVETLYPGAGRGAEKVDAVVTAVQSLAPTIGTSAQQVALLTDSIKGIASTVVAAMNAAGHAPVIAAPVAASSSAVPAASLNPPL